MSRWDNWRRDWPLVGYSKPKARIEIAPADHARLFALHHLSDERGIELSLLGAAVVRGGRPAVLKLIVPAMQEASASRVEPILGPAEVMAIGEAAPLWVHTHLCEPFWSSTDEATIARLASPKQDAVAWSMSIVVGDRRRLRARVDLYAPIKDHWDGLSLSGSVSGALVEHAIVQLRKELDGKVREVTFEEYLDKEGKSWQTRFGSPRYPW